MSTLRMARSPMWVSLTLALLVALFVAACSDDSEAGTPASSSTATAEATEPGGAATAEPTNGEADGSGDATTEVTIEHYSGTDTVPVNPETVVVMDLGVLLTLDALGVEVDAVGAFGSTVPAEYDALINNPEYEPIGTAFEPDYEAINALEPDLIIVATRSSATYPEMSRIAPTVDLTLGDGDFLDELTKQVNDLASIFQVQDRADELLAELNAEVEALQQETPDAGTALIVMTSGAEVSAYGPGSRFGMVHDVFGYAAADESLERDATHGDVISFEFILDANPDVLFVVDRSAAIGEEAENAQAVLDNELVHQTTAWQNDRVVYVDGFAWYMATSSIPAVHQIIADIRASLP